MRRVGRASRRFGGAVAVGVAATLLVGTPSSAEPGSQWRAPEGKDVTGVAVAPVKHKVRPVWTAGDREVRKAPRVDWPAPGTATVDVAEPARARGADAVGAKAGDLPVWVSGVSDQAGQRALDGTASASVGRVTVQVADRASAARAGVPGVVLRIGRADNVRAGGAVTVRVDYSKFARAYGGAWASRLRLVTLPDGTPLDSTNDLASSTVSAVVPLSATGASAVALASSASGDNGDYSATSLSAAGKWQVSQQTGDFSWSNTIRVVPGVGGPEPTLQMSYSSGSVDGRTGGTNTQGSWIGDGWEMWPGYIERKYKPCDTDKTAVGGVTPNNTSYHGGDLCWGKPDGNATMSLNGRATELVKSTGNTWKGVSDDGSKVELLKNTSFANTDDDGEYWKITTTDGTQYFFGRNTGPGGSSGSTATKSVWTVPVYGNHPNEPGYTAGNFPGSRRTQAWRWNLDHVVDPHGNTMTYFYERETGAYAREDDVNKRTTYDRGGHLTRVEYGNRTDAPSTTRAAAQVLFETEDRCVTNCWSGSNPVAASWVDTPWDQYCAAAPCTTQTAPTFWTSQRLDTIRSQVYSGSGDTYNDVESWRLRHTYLQSGGNEGEPMWLAGITRTGKVTTAGGSEVSDPETVFDPGSEPLANRVDGPHDGRSNLFRYRINTITTEGGAQIAVSYSSTECTRSNRPTEHNNTKRCFPQYYGPPGEEPTLDWFHKYVVNRIDVYDNTGGFTHEQTNYDYLDTPAWRYDDSELVEPEKRTWGDYRGYSRVQVRTGLESGVQSATEYLYLRGMDGDKQPSGTRDVWITDSQGTGIEDHNAYSGMLREQTTLLGDDGPWISGTIYTPVKQGPNATAGPLNAWMVNTGTTRTRTKLADGSTRWTKSVTTFNSDNLPTQTDEFGDEATTSDDVCTRTWYARNANNWMLDRVKRTERLGVNCAATPTLPGDMLASTRNTYDDVNNDWDTDLPERGIVAKVENISSWSGTIPLWTTSARTEYDANGRATDAYDALGRVTSTEFTPSTSGPVTTVKVTNAAGHTATTTMVPAWKLPATIVGENGSRTDMTYDGLGRLLKVWGPGRAKATYPNAPNAEFTYLPHTTRPTAVISKQLTPSVSPTYSTSITLYDGLLRERQTQTQAPGGGRIITDTVYDSRGLVEWASVPYYDSSGTAPEPILVGGVGASVVPAHTENVYDGAGRLTNAIFKIALTEKWRTVTAHHGDRATVTPPDGGTATTTIVDALGRTTELRQYKNRADAGSTNPSTYTSISYTYSRRDELVAMTDAAGNTWRYTYDQLGRQISEEDPDQGVNTTTYDAAGQPVTRTDARNITLAYTYDTLGRPTSLRDGSTTGPKRAEWVYDTLTNGIGKLTESIRYEPAGSTNAYTTRVNGYDTAGRPTGSSVTIPASETGLCAAGTLTPCTYTTSVTYRPNGSLATSRLPAAAGLPSENLAHLYNDIGLENSLMSTTHSLVYTGVTYNKLGQVIEQQLGGSSTPLVISNGFDERTGRRTTSTATPHAKPPVFDFAYTYDHAGNLTEIADTPLGGAADTQCYTYDHLRRLTNAWTPSSNDCDATRTVAGLGGPAPYWHSYTYDDTGNRLTETRHATTNTVHTYQHPTPGGPAGSKPHTVTSITTTGPNPATKTYTYDAAGNTTSRPGPTGTQTLTWNNEGKLDTVTEGTDDTTYLYDADGNRLIRRDPTGATLYLPGGTEVRKDNSAAATATRYYSGAAGTIAVRDNSGNLNWLAADHHGTAEATVDKNTLNASRRRTLPFGEERGTTSGTWPTVMDKGFVGGTKDDTGLTHIGARHYDPAIGRFISVDPIIDHADPQQWHGYAYSNNNPATYSDPTGLKHLSASRDGGGPTPAPKEPPTEVTVWPNIGDTNKNNKNNKTWWQKVGSGIYSGVKQSTYDPFVAAVNTVVDGWTSTINNGKAVLDGRMSITDFATEAAVTLGTNYVTALISPVVAVYDAYAGLLGTWGHVANGDWEGAAESWTKGAIAGASLAAGGRVGIKSPGCNNSFLPTTLVLMADGTTKPIAALAIGDEVLATDPETGVTATKPVTALIIGDGAKTLVKVITDSVGTQDRDEILTATGDHPFWVASQDAWRDAIDLRAGDELLTPDGARVRVIDIVAYDKIATVHNLTVADIHTYYVIAGDQPVLVHNCGPVPNNRPGDLSLELMEADFAGISPVAAGTSGFSRAASGSGDFLWTVGEGGNLNMVAAGRGIHHTVASGGAPVMAAGQISFRNGAVTSFDNMTGHYTPCPSCAGTFIQRGVDAFGAAGVRIPLRAIRDYGGRAP
ncbi:polymorphic toxin-type HINT domain-containing protein [Polymorphospora lycopeni]|uniref:Polymorphic toxin-type HINT domain-containing protein n=1 Tax=Polymorphospora lycopeni TaxID=3140240 RepID=A0ABV5D598_9ACTN